MAPELQELSRLSARWAGHHRRRLSPAFVASRQAARLARIERGLRIGDLSPEELFAELLPIEGGANNFTATLDTTAPADPTMVINGGAASATSVNATADFSTSDSSTTGYQIKIWGSGIDTAANPNIQDTEGNSSWINYTASQAIQLTAGNGSKSVSAKIRDDVWNETSTLTDTITLDTSIPVVSILTGPDVTRVSKIAGKRTINVEWESDSDVDEYKIKVVPATNSLHTAGTTIPETNSTNTQAGPGAGIAALENVATVIDGRDIETASAGDGDKIIKIFAKEASGNWSI